MSDLQIGDFLLGPPRVFDEDPRVVSSRSRAPIFTADGLAVVYPIGGDNNVDNLWMQPLDS